VPKLSKGAKRRFQFYGGLVSAVIGVYFYQPNRFDLLPKPVPKPNPPIDPDSKQLFAKGTKILVVTAHPDDTEFYLGGILTRFAKSGADVEEVVCTDGDKSYYLWQNSGQLRTIRRAEQWASAQASHVHKVTFLAYPDGRLFPNEDVVVRLRQEIDRFKPEYLIAFDGDYPPRRYHRDHTNSGIAAFRAVQGTATEWALLFASHAPNYTVDISDQWERQKQLLAIHKSQFSGEHLEMIINTVEDTAITDGDRIGVTYGESFRCVKLR
jgi:LmbE family N-acetylglucosaminyl deacetylase